MLKTTTTAACRASKTTTFKYATQRCKSNQTKFTRAATLTITSNMQQQPKENVQDYPRPPRLEPTPRHLVVKLNGHTIADTTNAYRVLETHHPPTYYLPPTDITPGTITPATDILPTMCEWKGRASYYNVTAGGETVRGRVWAYPTPTPSFQPIAGYYSFYADPFECWVDGEKVVGQPGDFYGGWITSDIEGQIKGAPGTRWW